MGIRYRYDIGCDGSGCSEWLGTYLSRDGVMWEAADKRWVRWGRRWYCPACAERGRYRSDAEWSQFVAELKVLG